MTASKEPLPRRRRLPLAARLTMLGLAQLALLVSMAFVIGAAVRPPHLHDLTARLDEAVRRIEDAEATGASVSPALHALASESGLALSLYGADGSLLASSGSAVLRPAEAREIAAGRGPRWARPPRSERPVVAPDILEPSPAPESSPDLLPPPPDEQRRNSFFVVAPFGRGPRPPIVRFLRHGRVLAARGEAGPEYVAPLLTALVGVLVIGLGALLTARWIVRPLEAIAQAAERVGEGDLAARTGLTRADELGKVAEEFDRMASRVELMRAAERELLANVSHELRTPLARLRVALDLASEGHVEALEDVASDLGELEGIIDDVLMTFRFEGKGRDRKSGLPVGTLYDVGADDLVRASERRFTSRHASRPLRVSVEPGLVVLADQNVLRRALDNLLENADKYSPEPDAAIDLRAYRRDDAVVLEVEDRGMGIEAADLPRIFEPFFRAERSRTRTAGGVGLGLALSQRIVAAHDGTIEVESEVGRGTTMRIVLPRPRLSGLGLGAADSTA